MISRMKRTILATIFLLQLTGCSTSIKPSNLQSAENSINLSEQAFRNYQVNQKNIIRLKNMPSNNSLAKQTENEFNANMKKAGESSKGLATDSLTVAYSHLKLVALNEAKLSQKQRIKYKSLVKRADSIFNSLK